VREHREAARPIVAGHGGRIVKTTGDGVLLEFPSVVAAVECAMSSRSSWRRNAPEGKRMLYRIVDNEHAQIEAAYPTSSRHTAITEAITSTKPANICNVRRSPNTAHPNTTATIGLTKV
jgi:hypothetical protein